MDWSTELDTKIAAYLPDLAIEKDVPLAGYTSFRIGGGAKRMAFPVNGEQLVLLHGMASACGARVWILGNGTNVLAADEGVDGLIIHTGRMDGLTLSPDGRITAQAGVSLSRLALFAQKNALDGLAFAYGIPGSVGGGICMNAGAYGGELAGAVEQVTVFFPEEGIRYFTAAEMAFGYRHSLLTERPEGVVLSAVFRLKAGDSAAIRAQMDQWMARRKSSQPLEYPSAGSTFKRPAGNYAGALIEQAGLKGLRVGDAQVSEKHAGFVINTGHATCRDVLALMEQVRGRVMECSGVLLEPEVIVVR